MGIEALVGILGLAAAVVVPIGTYLKTNPRRQLRYRVDVIPLLSEGASSAGRLMITLDGQPVTNPQIVTLSLWSTGRADISSQAFDAGQPLTFDLGAPVVEEISSEPNESPRLEVALPDKVLLHPALLHRKFQSSVRVVVDGAPNVRVNRVLPDIDVVRDGVSATVRAIHVSRKRVRFTPLLAWTGLLAVGVIALIVGLVIYNSDQKAYLPWGVVGVLVIMVSLLAITIIAIFRFIRWAGRNIEARSGLR